MSVLRLLLSGDPLIIFTVPFHSSYVRLPRYIGKILASGSTSEVWNVFINIFLITCFEIMFSTLRGHDCIHVHRVNPKENLLLHGSHRPWVNSRYVRTQWISSEFLYCDRSWEGHNFIYFAQRKEFRCHLRDRILFLMLAYTSYFSFISTWKWYMGWKKF